MTNNWNNDWNYNNWNNNNWNNDWNNNNWNHNWNSYSKYNPWYQRISAREAIQIALFWVPGRVIDVELDMENGLLVYEIEILTRQGIKYEVEVDAFTGRILNIELD